MMRATRISTAGRMYQRSLASSSVLLSSSTMISPSSLTQKRRLAVYAVGEGWTGALGTGRFDETIAGHDDEDYDNNGRDDDEHNLSPPIQIYEASVHATAVGWGHTAVIPAGEKPTLLVTGRPHDFSALLRLHRLPPMIRDFMVRQTLANLQGSTGIGNSNDGSQNLSMAPTALVGRFVTFLTEILQPLEKQKEWELGAQYSMLPTLQPVPLPDDDIPVQVACSAGLTAVIGASGTLYTFGLNGFGQCGIGESTNNVWAPTPVTGLSTEFAADGPRSEMPQKHAITSVALGLQHGVVLNAVGEIFAFGKGDRGQLGQESATKESHTALPIRKAYRLDPHRDDPDENLRPTYLTLGKVKQIASGMLHSAVLTEDNQVAIWGKHILRPTSDEPSKKALDSRIPSILTGLPEGPTVEQIACGSHHTSVLLSDGSVWAVGISADTKTPIHDPVELIPKGILQLPVRQFDAHMDRTTIVGADGRQVLQVHLWSDPELREFAIFTPPYVDRLLDENETMRIREIHRSWKHTVIVTD
jgi:hypothetical protein